jgi:hypothetical protein
MLELRFRRYSNRCSYPWWDREAKTYKSRKLLRTPLGWRGGYRAHALGRLITRGSPWVCKCKGVGAALSE